TAAPASFARVRVSWKELSSTPTATTLPPPPSPHPMGRGQGEGFSAHKINTHENETHHQRIQTASPHPRCRPVRRLRRHAPHQRRGAGRRRGVSRSRNL